MFYLYTPLKRIFSEFFWCFQGLKKATSGMEWINGLKLNMQKCRSSRSEVLSEKGALKKFLKVKGKHQCAGVDLEVVN